MNPKSPYITQNSELYFYTPSLTAETLFFYPICIGSYEYEAGYCLKRSNYNSFLLMLILEGSMNISTPYHNIQAKKNSAVLLNCYHPHQYNSPQGCKALWLHYDGPLAASYYELIQKKWGSLISPCSFSSVKCLLETIYHTFQKGDSIGEALISANITSILNYFLSPSAGIPSQNSFSAVEESIAYIREHFREEIHLEQLAKKAALSPYYFTRVFSRKTGMTPYQYLISTRITASKFLLKSTDCSIKEISYQSGFPNVSNFCTTFKKWEGCTPGQYRCHPSS